MKTHSIFLLTAILVWLPAQASAQTNHNWRNVQVEIPAGWEATDQTDEQRGHMLRLEAKNANPKVTVMIAMMPDPPAVDEQYRQGPGLGAFSFVYPLLKRVSENTEGRGAIVSFGQILLGAGPAAAAHATMPTPDGSRIITANAFVQHRGSILLFGAVISQARADSINDSPAHHRAIKEAYGLLRTLTVR